MAWIRITLTVSKIALVLLVKYNFNMSIFFLNSTNRVYNDEELNAISKVLFSAGVFNTTQATRALWKTAGDFLVEPSGGSLNVTAKPGMASVTLITDPQQAFIKEDTELSANVASNLTLANRNDAVVLRIDQSVLDDDILNTAGSNAVSLVVVSGNSANVLTDNEISVALGGDPFVRLADMLVPLSATEITAGMITDRRTQPKMTSGVKFASDSFGFLALESDPENLEEGDVWFNSTQGILKMYNGTNTIALQSQSFDWGYYPPNGIDQHLEHFDPVAENASVNSQSQLGIYQVLNLSGGAYLTLMAGEVFEMPNISNPYIRVKMGNPSYPASIGVKICTLDGANLPNAVVETPASFDVENVPSNDYIGFYLDGALYTPGVKYAVVLYSNRFGFINSGNDGDFYQGQVPFSYPSVDEYDNTILLGAIQGSSSTIATANPLGVTWGDYSAYSTRHLIIEISEREELRFGQTDTSGKKHIISQYFSPKSKDIIGFQVIKGEDVGTPTGDITASLYRANDNDEPTGNIITEGIITNAEWGAVTAGSPISFPIIFDELVVGERYVVVIDTDNYSDNDNYSVYFGASVTGTAKYQNTSNGWLALNGDLFFGIVTSSVRKIVVTNDQGFIDPDLVPVLPKRVTSIVSSATPAYNIETSDAINITALVENITDMSTNQIGTPYDFQEIDFRIAASGAIRTIAWGTKFASGGVALDTSIALGKVLSAKFIYNAVTAKFECVRSVETV